MRTPFFILLMFSSILSAFSQDTVQRSLSYRARTGSYDLGFYDSNIIRIQFSPFGYKTSEQLSDAVILGRSGSTAIQHYFFHDSVVLDYRGVHVAVFPWRRNDYRGFGLLLREGEKIFGGGERAIPLNRRGYRLELYNQPVYGYAEGAENLNYSVPFFTSSKGYAVFFDNPSKGYADIGKKDPSMFEYGAVSGELNVYVIFGDYQQILRSYHRLTGTQPLPPRWTLGNLMSRFGYTSEAQVNDVLGQMRSNGIPVDAVIFDLFWFGDSIKGTLGNLEWMNRKAWPYPGKMIRGLKNAGIQSVLVTEPYVVSSSKNYRNARKYFAVNSEKEAYELTDFYFGKAGLIDLFRRDAQRWFLQTYRKQMNDGVEGWWSDLGEPEKHPSDLFHNMRDKGYKRLFGADEVHNLYGHQWTKMIFDFYKREHTTKRLFSLNRSGFAGSQRYSIFPWSGDVSRSWSGFRAQLPVLLGMSMSGVPYVHSDAGGFAGGEGDNELYVRWLQFAAFTPVLRAHGTALYSIDPSAYSFPSEAALIDSPYRDFAKWAIQYRYLFLPYNYTLSYLQTKNGEPLMAPMYYYYPEDSTAVNAEDQYMWGSNVLVAPVLQKGASTRSTYLPQGTWYRFFDTAVINGGRYVTDTLRMETIPVYVREGSFIPLWSPGQHAIHTTSDYDTVHNLNLRYYPSLKQSQYELFEDDGKSVNTIRSGKYGRTIFTGITAGNTATITIRSEGPVFSSRTIDIQVPRRINWQQSTIDGKSLPDTARARLQYGYHKNHLYDVIRIEYVNKPVTVRIKMED